MNKNLTDLVSIQAFYLAHDNGIISSSRNTKEELAEHFLDLEIGRASCRVRV